MTTSTSLAEAETRLRRAGEYIEELRRAGRSEDAEAISFVRDLAERALVKEGAAAQRELLTTGQAALALGVSDQTVRNWVAAGRLPAVKRGVRTMIPRQAVLEEIERSRVQPSVSPGGGAEAEETAWRRDLLTALPRDVAARLDELHDKLEDGRRLSAAEEAELRRLEQEMATAAARNLQRMIGREQTGPR